MRQLLKQLIPLLKQLRRYQKVNQPTDYTLFRREGGKAWNTLTQEEKDPWNTEAKAIREKKNEEREEEEEEEYKKSSLESESGVRGEL